MSAKIKEIVAAIVKNSILLKLRQFRQKKDNTKLEELSYRAYSRSLVKPFGSQRILSQRTFAGRSVRKAKK